MKKSTLLFDDFTTSHFVAWTRSQNVSDVCSAYLSQALHCAFRFVRQSKISPSSPKSPLRRRHPLPRPLCKSRWWGIQRNPRDGENAYPSGRATTADPAEVYQPQNGGDLRQSWNIALPTPTIYIGTRTESRNDPSRGSIFFNINKLSSITV